MIYIPLWYYLNFKYLSCSISISIIYIPLWYYLNNNCKEKQSLFHINLHSIMVLLKLLSFLALATKNIYLHSIMVLLKYICENPSYKIIPYLHSIMVLLKSTTNWTSFSRWNIYIPLWYYLNEYNYSSYYDYIMYLHSIMVLLKSAIMLLNNMTKEHLHSIMVLLKSKTQREAGKLL